MKHIIAASLVVSISLCSQAPFAQPLKDEVAYNWSGVYAGLNAGFVQHTMHMTDVQASSFNATIAQVANPKFSGGFQVGYRSQLDLSYSSGVFGLEFSDTISDVKFNKNYGSPYALYQLSSENKLNNIALLQMIGGITANRTLLFLAAGGSRTHVSGFVKNTDGIPFFNGFSVSDTAFSAAFGGGIEYAFSRAISGRFKLDVILPNTFSTYDNTGDNYQISNSVVQATFGVNYRFG